ncbi:hypothetical protein D3C78_1065820 [compost metagenome]
MEDGARGIGEFTNLEPGDGVQYLMQAGWDQQTVNETEDAGTHSAHGHNPFTAGVDGILNRWPDITKDRRKD